MSVAIPLTVYSTRYLWDRCERDSVMTRRTYLVMCRQCNCLLRSNSFVRRMQFAISLGNLSQDGFVDGFNDLPLDIEQLAAIYYALTR